MNIRGYMIDEKKAHIVAVAEQLFAHYGIRKTTMEDIAKKARLGKSTLYYYFQSKEDVFGQVIKKDSKEYKKKLNQAIANGKSPQEKINNYVLTRMIHLKELINYYSTLTEEYLEQYPLTEITRKEFIDYEIRTISYILEDGVSQGVFSIANIETTARNFAICLKGLEYSFLMNDIKNDIENESKQILTILFKGIEKR